MIGLRLGLRLARGGGRAEWLRLALMVAGVAFGAVMILVILTIPSVLSDRNAVAAQRMPVRAMDGAAPAFTAYPTRTTLGDRLWTTMLIADVRPGAPLPPGLDRFPAPGEAFVSPAVADALRTDPMLAVRVPGRVVGSIAPAGLTGPDDYYAYVGMRRESLPEGDADCIGFGLPDGAADEIPLTGLTWEILLLVGLPTCLYLVTCAQLSAATRARRYAALRLVGMHNTEVARMAGIEGSITALVGTLLGLALYGLIDDTLAGSGVFGFEWYPQGLSTPTAVALIFVICVASYLLGRSSTRITARDPIRARKEGDASPGSWLRLLPLTAAAGSLACVAVLRLVSPDLDLSVSGAAPILLGSAILAMVGLPLGLRPLTTRLASLIADRTSSPTVRLGARRLQYEPSSAIRVLTSMVVLILVCGAAAGVLEELRLTAGAEARLQLVGVQASSIRDAASRQHVLDLPHAAQVVALGNKAETEGDFTRPSTPDEMLAWGRVNAFFASCRDVRILTGLRLPDCHDGQAYRLQDPDGGLGRNTIPIDRPITFPTADGEVTLRTPRAELSVPGLVAGVPGIDFNSLLFTMERLPGGKAWPGEALLRLAVAPNELDATQTAISGVDPGAEIDVENRDLPLLEAYRVHRSVIVAGVALGFLCALVALFITAFDRAMERRANIAMLLVVGVPERMLRGAQIVQLFLPLLLGLVIALVLGDLAGMAYLAYGGQYQGFFVGGIRLALPLVLVAVLLAAISGSVVVGRELRTERLRRE